MIPDELEDWSKVWSPGVCPSDSLVRAEDCPTDLDRSLRNTPCCRAYLYAGVDGSKPLMEHPEVIDTATDRLETLEAPPIVEVACGFLFEPMPQIDPISLGAFWHRVQDRFPERALRYPVEDGGGQLTFGNAPPPMRTWMISATGETLLQVQRDRVFFNWRAVGPEYPRFSAEGGVRSQALEAFGALCEYLEATFGSRPAVRAVEVLKIDMLEQGIHWQDHADAALMLPALAVALSGSPLGSPALNLRLSGEQDGCALRLKVDLLRQAGSQSVRVETVARAAAEGTSIEDALSTASQKANGLFGWLIPKNQRDTRFKRRD